jgi:hypothetical protein
MLVLQAQASTNSSTDSTYCCAHASTDCCTNSVTYTATNSNTHTCTYTTANANAVFTHCGAHTSTYAATNTNSKLLGLLCYRCSAGSAVRPQGHWVQC